MLWLRAFASNDDGPRGGSRDRAREPADAGASDHATDDVSVPAPADAHHRAALARTRDLVVRLQSGDVDAFRSVYVEYYRRLWEFAYGLVRNEAGAEDVVHDVFSILWTSRATLDIRDTIDAYLFGAVRHRALNTLRHVQLASRKHATLDPDIGTMPGMGTTTASPDAHTIAADFAEALRIAVEQLPERQQHAILLHWRHGLSNGEIARILGISSNAAAAQLLRARESLRRLVRRYLDR